MKLSITIPMYREEDNVAPLLDELIPALEELGESFEVILVDDGSDDRTAEFIAERARDDERIRCLRFQKNHGQSAALAAAFGAARGEIVVTMDGDLQCDPRAIGELLPYLDEHDCVCGQRQKRRDSFVRRASSRIANGIRNLITGDRVVDTGSPLKLIRRRHLMRIPHFNGLHRFLPTLLKKVAGARVIEVPVNHRPRQHGASKYGIGNRALRGLRDCFGVRWLTARAIRWQDDLLPEE